MNTLTVILLTTNIIGMIFLYFTINRRFSKNKYMEDMHTEVQKLIRDIEFESDRCVTLLDDRITAVQEILDVVDKHIEIAEKEFSNKQKEVVVLDKLMDNTTKKVKRTQPPKKQKNITIYSDELKSKGVQPEQLKLSLSNQKEQVLEMHHQGIDHEIISQKTGIPMGEIELILSLNP